MMAINRVTTTIVNGILSCLHSNARFIRGKSWKRRLFPKPVIEIAKTSILPTMCFKQFLCSWRLASTFGKSLSVVFVAIKFKFCMTGRRVCHHCHIASEGIPGSGIPERNFVKNSYKHSRTSLPSPPLLFIVFFTSHCSPLSEHLEQTSMRYIVAQFAHESVGLCPFRGSYVREFELLHSNPVNIIIKINNAHNLHVKALLQFLCKRTQFVYQKICSNDFTKSPRLYNICN